MSRCPCCNAKDCNCFWSHRHAAVCGHHCAYHCRALGYGPDGNGDMQAYYAALAEGRVGLKTRIRGVAIHGKLPSERF